MSTEQIKTFAMEAVVSHPPREVRVVTLDDSFIVGEVHFAGHTKFRVDTPQAAIFFRYDEVEAVEYA